MATGRRLSPWAANFAMKPYISLPSEGGARPAPSTPRCPRRRLGGSSGPWNLYHFFLLCTFAGVPAGAFLFNLI